MKVLGNTASVRKYYRSHRNDIIKQKTLHACKQEGRIPRAGSMTVRKGKGSTTAASKKGRALSIRFFLSEYLIRGRVRFAERNSPGKTPSQVSPRRPIFDET